MTDKIYNVLFLALPLTTLDEMATRRELQDIGQSEAASAKAGEAL